MLLAPAIPSHEIVKERGMLQFLERLSQGLNKILMWVGGGILAVMIILTCANIFCRVVWLPIRGTFELMGYMGAVVTAFALGYTQTKKGHIAVDILILGFSPKVRRVLDGINNLVCFLFFSVVSWQIARYATTLWRTGEVTETLRIIYYPFTYAVALGCAALALVFLTGLLKSLLEKEEGK